MGSPGDVAKTVSAAVATEQAGLESGIGLRMSVAQRSGEHRAFLQTLGYQCGRAITILTSVDYIEVSVCGIHNPLVPRELPGSKENGAGFALLFLNGP